MSESPRCWRKRQYFERTFILEASPCWWERDFQWRGFCALSFKVDSSSWLSFLWGSTNRSEWVSVAQKRRWGQRGSKQQLLLRPDLDVGQGWKIFGFASKSFRAGKKTYKTGLQMNTFWKFLSKTAFGRKRNRIYIFLCFKGQGRGENIYLLNFSFLLFPTFSSLLTPDGKTATASEANNWMLATLAYSSLGRKDISRLVAREMVNPRLLVALTSISTSQMLFKLGFSAWDNTKFYSNWDLSSWTTLNLAD